MRKLPIVDKSNVPYLSESSGLKTTSAVVNADACILMDLIVYTDGVNTATVTLYDSNSGASGTVLAKIVVAGSELMGGEVNIYGRAENGIYAELSGTGASYLVRYID